MDNPYLPPTATVADKQRRAPRVLHSIAAFVAGMVITPLTIYITARVLLGAQAEMPSSSLFWGLTLLGSALASAVVYGYPYNRIPTWVAVVAGVLG